MYSLESSHESEGYLLFQMHSLSVALQSKETKFLTGVKMNMFRWKFVIFSYFCAKRAVWLIRSVIHWHAYAINNLYSCKMSILGEICNMCFIIAQNINCGYSLELPHWSSSNKNLLCFRAEIREIMFSIKHYKSTHVHTCTCNFLLWSQKWNKLTTYSVCIH